MGIKFAIMDAIYRGAKTRSEIARKANMNDCNVARPLLKSLEEQGFIVSEDMGFLHEIGHKGGHQLHYAITERARLWMMVAQRAEELAPK